MKRMGLLLLSLMWGLLCCSAVAREVSWSAFKASCDLPDGCILGNERDESQHFVIAADADSGKMQVGYRSQGTGKYELQYYSHRNSSPQYFGWGVQTFKLKDQGNNKDGDFDLDSDNSLILKRGGGTKSIDITGRWGVYTTSGEGDLFECATIKKRVLEQGPPMREEMVVNGYFGGRNCKYLNDNLSRCKSKCNYKIRHSIIYQQGDKHISHSASITPLWKIQDEYVNLFFGGDATAGNSDTGFPYFDPVLGYPGIYECEGGSSSSCLSNKVGDTFFVLQPSSAGYFYESGHYYSSAVQYEENALEEGKNGGEEGIRHDGYKNGLLSCHPNREQVFIATEAVNNPLDPNDVSWFYQYKSEGKDFDLHIRTDMGVERDIADIKKGRNITGIKTGINNAITYQKQNNNYYVDAAIATQWIIPAKDIEAGKIKSFYISQCFDKPCLRQSAVIKEFRVLDELVDAEKLEADNIDDFIASDAFKGSYTLDNAAGKMICRDNKDNIIPSDRTNFVPGKKITCSVEDNEDDLYTFVGWAQIDEEKGNSEPDGAICNLNKKAYQNAEKRNVCAQTLKVGPAKSACYKNAFYHENNNKIFIAVLAQKKLTFRGRVEVPDGGTLTCYALLPDKSGERKLSDPIILSPKVTPDNKPNLSELKTYGYKTPISCFAENATDFTFDGWSIDGSATLSDEEAKKITMDQSDKVAWETYVKNINNWKDSKGKYKSFTLKKDTVLTAQFSKPEQVKVFSRFTIDKVKDGNDSTVPVTGSDLNALNNLLICKQKNKSASPVFVAEKNADPDTNNIICTFKKSKLPKRFTLKEVAWLCDGVDEEGINKTGSCKKTCTDNQRCVLAADQHQRITIALTKAPKLTVDDDNDDKNMSCEIAEPSPADKTNPVTPGNSGRPKYNTKVSCNFDPDKGDILCIDPSDEETCKAVKKCNTNNPQSPCVFNVTGDLTVSVKKEINLEVLVNISKLKDLANIQCQDKTGAVVNLGENKKIAGGAINCTQTKKEDGFEKYHFLGWSVNGAPPVFTGISMMDSGRITAIYEEAEVMNVFIKIDNKLMRKLPQYNLSEQDIYDGFACKNANGDKIINKTALLFRQKGIVVKKGDDSKNTPHFAATVDSSTMTCTLDPEQGHYDFELVYEPLNLVRINAVFKGPGIVGGECRPRRTEPGETIDCKVIFDSTKAKRIDWTINHGMLHCQASDDPGIEKCSFKVPMSTDSEPFAPIIDVFAVGNRTDGPDSDHILLTAGYAGEGITGVTCTSLKAEPNDDVSCRVVFDENNPAKTLSWNIGGEVKCSGKASENTICSFKVPASDIKLTVTGGQAEAIPDVSPVEGYPRACQGNACTFERRTNWVIIVKDIRKLMPETIKNIPLSWLVYILLLLSMPGGVYYAQFLRKPR